MSDLTRCNYHTLQDMRVTAKMRGVEVIVYREEQNEDFKGWTAVRYSDREEPSAYFMALSEHCEC